MKLLPDQKMNNSLTESVQKIRIYRVFSRLIPYIYYHWYIYQYGYNLDYPAFFAAKYFLYFRTANESLTYGSNKIAPNGKAIPNSSRCRTLLKSYPVSSPQISMAKTITIESADI